MPAAGKPNPKVTPIKQWYAVVTILGNIRTYCGQREGECAKCWLPGTAYGKGEDEQTAKANADTWAAYYRGKPFYKGMLK